MIILSFFNAGFCLAQNVEQNNYTDSEIIEYFRASYNLEKYDEALKLIEALPKEKYDEEIYLLLGNIAQSKGNNEKTVENYNSALKINPKFYKAYYNLGNFYFIKSDYNLAIENYKKATKFNKDFAPAYYNLGCAYLKLEKPKNAKPNFIRAISINPQNPNYYYNLAIAYKMLKKEKTAQKILDSLNLQPSKKSN